MEDVKYWIWLRLLQGIGSVIERKLLVHFGNPKNIYVADRMQLLEVIGVGTKLADTIVRSRSFEQALKILDNVEKHGISILTIDNPLYPSQLLKCERAPVVLYYKGTIRSSKSAVAIVGARRCTSYGKQIAMEAGSYLGRYGIPVVSGMAKGIDSYAQTACIKAGGYTISVVAHGLDSCYPKEHRELMQAVIESGLVISAYPPGVEPRPEYFPERNHLIVSLSSKVLVVEAAIKSGALITAELARQQNKEILAPPHNIYSISGKGCNQLINTGVNIYIHHHQLIDILDTEVEHKLSTNVQANLLPENENKVINCLTKSPKTIEEIEKHAGINQLDLLELLSIMELEGHIQTIAGGRFKVG